MSDLNFPYLTSTAGHLNFPDQERGLRRMLRKENLLVLALIMLALIGLFPLFSSLMSAQSPGDDNPTILTVVFFDVHQGDAALISTPDGKHFLIDAGQGASKYTSFDGGGNVVIPYLKEHKIDQLDMVVMTHAHADHVGGLISVLENIKVKQVVDPGMNYTSSLYKRFLLLVESKGIEWVEARDMMVLYDNNGVRAQVMSPGALYEGTRSDPNNNSVVIKIEYKATSFLFTGDIEETAELDLLDYGMNLRSNVLKVPHHGGEFSSTDGFVRRVRPAMAVISCGKDNKFGHPKPQTLESYQKIGAKIFRTDLCGTITMLSDGKRISVRTEKPCQ